MDIIILEIVALVEAVLIVVLFKRFRECTMRYIALEEWAEDRTERLENDVKIADMKAAGAQAVTEDHWKKLGEFEKKVEELETLLPKNSRGELIRNEVLLQQMNDELERGIKMEKDWNDGVAAILNYGKQKTEVI